MKTFFIYCILLFSLITLAGCGGSSSSGSNQESKRDQRPPIEPPIVPEPPPEPEPEPYVYLVPEEVDDGWATASLESVGIATGIIETMTTRIEDGHFPGIDGIAIVKDGLLVYENYFNGYSRDQAHDLRSTTKSITSIVTGIAIDQGYLPGVDAPVLNYIDEYASFDNPDPRKYEIRIEDLLTMSAGLDCDDHTPSSPGNEENMYETDDWVKFTLDLPVVTDPGSRWRYCTGGVVVLGAVVANATGMAFDEYAHTNLFEPLQISNYVWEVTPADQIDTGGHLMMTPRDMAKLGQLFIQNGLWDGRQIVSSEWVEASTQSYVTLDEESGYGYLWWTVDFSFGGENIQAYQTRGNGGQHIYVSPDLNAVAVFTGSDFNSLDDEPSQLLSEYILPASE